MAGQYGVAAARSRWLTAVNAFAVGSGQGRAAIIVYRMFNRNSYGSGAAEPRPLAGALAFDLGAAAATQPSLALTEGVMAVDLSMPVLVVDDYNTMIRIIRNLLRQLGFENIDDASDGSLALAKMRDKRYGLVISDWNMEPMTGYELLKQVRADPLLSPVPFIMVTAESKTENVIAAKQAGVTNYIVKPFNAETLKSKIEAVFADA